MKLFFAPSCKHLTSDIASEIVSVNYFPDGEMCMRVACDIMPNEDTWVVASIGNSQAFFELLMMLDVLRAKGARIFLILTYLSYLRNDKKNHNNYFFGKTMLEIIQSFDIEKIIVVHPHALHIESSRVQIALWYDFFVDQARDYDLLVAPDLGAQPLVEKVGRITGKPTVFFNKQRTAQGAPIIEASICLAGERVLIIDDIISTGGTLAKASEILKHAGASFIAAAATHGIFCNDALSVLAQSGISKIVVTNSLHVQPHDLVTIKSISSFVIGLINDARSEEYTVY